MEKKIKIEHVDDIEYTPLTKEELANKYGASYPQFSQYSMKVSVKGEIVGYIGIENIPLKLSLNEDDEDEIKTYKEMINNINSFYLRKIEIDREHIDKLKGLFKETINRLPFFSILWSKPSIWDIDGLTQKIDELRPLAHNIDNNIYIFSLHC